MAGEPAKELYEQFLEDLTKEYKAMQTKLKIQTQKTAPVFPGAFGQYMNIEMVNDGPVTLVVDSQKDPKAVKKLEARLAREEKTKLNQQKQQEETRKRRQEESKGEPVEKGQEETQTANTQEKEPKS